MIVRSIKIALFFAIFAIYAVAFTPTQKASAYPSISDCENSGGQWIVSGTSETCRCPDDLTNEGCVNLGCDDKDKNIFFGLPLWYKYLDQQTVRDSTSGVDVCNAKLNGISDIWLIVAAVIEALLRVASLVAIGFTIYGGIQYMISQGAPDKTKQSQATVINAFVGLVISIVAAAIVSFIAGRFN